MTNTARTCLAIMGVILLLALTGCGGGTSQIVSGSYTGTFVTSAGQTGTITASNVAGTFSGTIHNTTTGADGTITGQYIEGGTSVLDFVYASSSDTVTGSLAYSGKKFTGTLTDSSGATITVVLTQS